MNILNEILSESIISDDKTIEWAFIFEGENAGRVFIEYSKRGTNSVHSFHVENNMLVIPGIMVTGINPDDKASVLRIPINTCVALLKTYTDAQIKY